jgi:hypothetical protein
VVSGYGNAAGYHLEDGGPVHGVVHWRTVAVLDPGGVQAASWTGYQCTSGSGRYAAVAVLPASAADSPAELADGGYAFSVDLRTGRVRLVSTHVRIGYDTPACGTTNTALFTAFNGAAETSTRILLANLQTGRLAESTAPGELTSAIPLGSQVVGVLGRRIVRIELRRGASPRIEAVAQPNGIPYELRVASRGRVYFMTTRLGGANAWAWQLQAGRTRLVATGRRLGMNLVAAGPAVGISGARTVASESGLLPVAGTSDPGAELSRDGRLLSDGEGGGAGKAALKASWRNGGLVRSVFEPDRVRTATLTEPPGTRPILAHSADAQSAACAVARLDPTRQAMQPDPAQVNWASQMAEQGLLAGSLGRPSGFDNMGTAAYSANGDFPPISLDHPAGDSWNTVPRSVFDAIMAQESNWDQASWHALPGIAGDPLIADYYGNGGNSIDSIDYAKADCGYGIAQVTDGMQVGSSLFSSDEQTRIAVDYEENIAAGLRILEQTWNALYQDGITSNGGDPRYLENWYFAAWAYNTGIEPNAAHGNATGCTPGPSCTGPDGTWGLGWANNPANPVYPPNRAPFLESSYADAAHPADWPYQERIMGWMASPLLDGNGNTSYAGPDYRGHQTWINIPPFNSFCAAVNDCAGAGLGTSGNCALADSECWWHESTNWVDCSTNCATSSYSIGPGSSEPAGTDPHPPTCSVDPSALPTTSNGPPIIVDQEGGPPVDLVGCGASNWSDAGSFTYTFGHNAAGDPIGAADTHQLGVGFGGHILFTHTEDGSNPALINTGTWTPDLPKVQYYDIEVHLPPTGAQITDAVYTINSNGYGGPAAISLDQAQHAGNWVDLGRFPLAPGGTVALTNKSSMTPDTYDVAFDAIAFLPQGGTPDPTSPPPPSNSPQCATSEVRFGSVDALSSCFTSASGSFTSTGTVRIGGVDITPVGSASITLQPDTGMLSVAGAVSVDVGSIQLLRGHDLSVSLKQSWTFAIEPGAQVKGLPLTGDATITLAGAGATIDVTVMVKMLGGVTGSAELAATNSDGLKLSSLSFKIAKAQIDAIGLRNVTLSYTRVDAGDQWTGNATVLLPFPEVKSVGGSATLLNGKLQNASATANTNLEVGDGIFLDQLRGSITLNPTFSFGGGITLSAGPKIGGVTAASLTGNFTYRDASGSTPAEFDLSGKLKLAALTLSNGSLSINSRGATTIAGDLNLTLAGVGFTGQVNGTIDGHSSIQASSSGKLSIDGHSINGQAIISTTGMGACGTLNLIGHVSVGFGVLWSQFPDPNVELDGCSLTTWSASASAASASTSRTARVPAGQPFVAFRVSGRGAPAVKVRGPHGQSIAPPAGATFVNNTGLFYLRDTLHTVTYLIVPHPAPGVWTVASSTAGEAIGTVATAYENPAAVIRARVSGSGHHRVLTYKAIALDGESIEFYDAAGKTTKLIARSASRYATIKFTPMTAASVGHRIVAVLLAHGIPRQRLDVASFRVARAAAVAEHTAAPHEAQGRRS